MNQTKKQLERPVSEVHSQPCAYTWCHAVAGCQKDTLTPKPVLPAPNAGVDAGVPKAGVDGCPNAYIAHYSPAATCKVV